MEGFAIPPPTVWLKIFSIHGIYHAPIYPLQVLDEGVLRVFLNKHGTRLDQMPDSAPSPGFVYVAAGYSNHTTGLTVVAVPYDSLEVSEFRDALNTYLVSDKLGQTRWYKVPKGLVCTISELPFA